MNRGKDRAGPTVTSAIPDSGLIRHELRHAAAAGGSQCGEEHLAIARGVPLGEVSELSLQRVSSRIRYWHTVLEPYCPNHTEMGLPKRQINSRSTVQRTGVNARLWRGPRDGAALTLDISLG